MKNKKRKKEQRQDEMNEAGSEQQLAGFPSCLPSFASDERGRAGRGAIGRVGGGEGGARRLMLFLLGGKRLICLDDSCVRL